MEKYENNEGQIGVIVSGGYGAGWSTWGGDSEFLSMDKGLVEMALNETPSKKVKAYIKEKKGFDKYMGGWEGVRVEFLSKGTSFDIEEYDGSESIRTYDDLRMTA